MPVFQILISVVNDLKENKIGGGRGESQSEKWKMHCYNCHNYIMICTIKIILNYTMASSVKISKIINEEYTIQLCSSFMIVYYGQLFIINE